SPPPTDPAISEAASACPGRLRDGRVSHPSLSPSLPRPPVPRPPQGPTAPLTARQFRLESRQSGAGEVEGATVAAETEARVGAHHHRVELEGVTVRVGDPGEGCLADQLRHPEVHRRGDRVADRAGAVVVLARGGTPEAAAGEG